MASRRTRGRRTPPCWLGWQRRLCREPWPLGLIAARASRRLGDPSEEGEVSAEDGCHARANGFDLPAGLVVPAGERDRLERTCRYALRPPVAQERLHVTEERQVRLQLRRPWREGTTDIVFDPIEAPRDGLWRCTKRAVMGNLRCGEERAGRAWGR